MMGGWKLAFGLVAALAWATAPAGAEPKKDTLTVDLPNDAATLDPHVQWDTDSYSIYRNMVDNLITHDVSGKIVPQVGSAWRYLDDTALGFTIQPCITFHDGSPLTAQDVAYSIARITNP